LGTHQYDTQVAEPWPSDVPQTKPVWMTEVAGVRGWPEGGPSSDISNGVAVAGWIHSALVTGDASAWLWWWYKPYNTNDNEGLLLESGTDTKRHYTLGNYSKFVRPGYVRVDVTGSISTDVLLSAYKGADGTVVVVAINKGSATVNVPIALSGGTAPASLTPWVTSATDNLKSGTAVAVSGGSFSATLASQTVTTFVGR
jgi:glucuronoarabinoxylan endo-1,4-beta-xylanase